MVVVAAVDDSDRASAVVEHANDLAEAFGDPVHVVHVMKRSEVVQAEQDGVSSDEPMTVDELRSTAATVSSDVLDRCTVAAETEAVGLIGDPASEIVEYASEHEARYIVVSPRRRSRTGKMLFGSVAQSVLLDAPCPVVSLLVE
ncbi:universal stress protein UspA [Salinigranum rubrum]|uniref:Universal stress protein UspA n=1 Tax=Salinigranum rubrum TaxID=755307 RepID=A0A2I8VNT1_9EURY|nr:universal stress protein [Salinigranum rubrum]AUV83590.1 universal stress protein UspA [Salinigranum rubrum]